jgi:hypothetical protein
LRAQQHLGVVSIMLQWLIAKKSMARVAGPQ